jgi:hypothetical protein
MLSRARPRPLSSWPCVNTPSSVDLPASALPITATRTSMLCWSSGTYSNRQHSVTCYCCISTLSRNNAILSDATIMDSLSFHCHVTMYQAVIDFHSNEFCCLQTPIGLKSLFIHVSRSREKHVSCYSGQ